MSTHEMQDLIGTFSGRTEAPTFAELEALLACLPAGEESGGNDCRGCRVESLRHSLENSWLYRGSLPPRGERVAIKLCRNSDSLASREYEALIRLHPYFTLFSGLSVPRPLQALPQHGLLLMEWVDGPTLTELLLDWRSARHRILEEIRRAGRWLSALHRYDSLGTAAVDVERMLWELENDTNPDVQRLTAEVPVARRALQILRDTAGPVSRVRLPVGSLHGDFKSDNLIVSGDRLVGLDIAMIWQGLVIRDIAPFLNHLELLTTHPRGIRLLPMRSRFVEAFYEGYGINDRLMPVRTLAWVRLVAALTGWAARHELQRRGARAWYVFRAFRWLSETLTRSLQ